MPVVEIPYSTATPAPTPEAVILIRIQGQRSRPHRGGGRQDRGPARGRGAPTSGARCHDHGEGRDRHRAAGRDRRAARDILGVAQLNLLRILRTPQMLAIGALRSAMLLVLLRQVLGGAIHIPGHSYCASTPPCSPGHPRRCIRLCLLVGVRDDRRLRASPPACAGTGFQLCPRHAVCRAGSRPVLEGLVDAPAGEQLGQQLGQPPGVEALRRRGYLIDRQPRPRQVVLGLVA